MGVMLTLDKPIARLRRRGQHTRTPEEQACLDAFAAFLRYDAPSAGRSLSRLATTVLASRLLPAARALADAVDLVLAEQPQAVQSVSALSTAAQSLTAQSLTAPPLAAQPLAAPLSPDATAYDRAAHGSGPPGARTVAMNFTVSAPCLLGICRDGACRSPRCEHACHSRPA
jgi:hypothetical protein